MHSDGRLKSNGGRGPVGTLWIPHYASAPLRDNFPLQVQYIARSVHKDFIHLYRFYCARLSLHLYYLQPCHTVSTVAGVATANTIAVRPITPTTP